LARPSSFVGGKGAVAVRRDPGLVILRRAEAAVLLGDLRHPAQRVVLRLNHTVGGIAGGAVGVRGRRGSAQCVIGKVLIGVAGTTLSGGNARLVLLDPAQAIENTDASRAQS